MWGEFQVIKIMTKKRSVRWWRQITRVMQWNGMNQRKCYIFVLMSMNKIDIVKMNKKKHDNVLFFDTIYFPYSIRQKVENSIIYHNIDWDANQPTGRFCTSLSTLVIFKRNTILWLGTSGSTMIYLSKHLFHARWKQRHNNWKNIWQSDKWRRESDQV